MYTTYKNLLILSDLYEGEETNSNLALKYQQTKDPIFLAVVYTRYYAYIKTTADNYFNLTDADKASFAIEELNKALLDYKLERGAKVQTLFIKYYKNRLRQETQATNLYKRRANNNCDNYETAEIFEGYKESSFGFVELELALEQADLLTENEKMYCKIIMSSDNVNDSDVAKKLEISPSAIFQIKKRLRTKIHKILNPTFDLMA